VRSGTFRSSQVNPKPTSMAALAAGGLGGMQRVAQDGDRLCDCGTCGVGVAELTGLSNEIGFNLFICECSDPGCAESLEITAGEYEAVRADRARFVIANGHQTPAVERVVDGKGRFLVVENIGAAAEIARAHATALS
jgi:hypothetical protein